MDVNTPILVGVGLTMQREARAADAEEALALMINASRAAGNDCTCPQLLHEIERISVPIGRWTYRNPAGLIGKAIGAPKATTISALVGVSQQTLLSDTCSAIASGDISAALVVGGETGFRLQRARIEGVTLQDEPSTDTADIVMKPQAELFPDYEQNTGLGQMPVGYYAIIDSAFRHAHRLSVDQYRDRIARRYAEFSTIAAGNPHAWNRDQFSMETIRNPSAENPMLAFPYTKLHNAQWHVDQASALLFCSVKKANALGISADKWVFPQVFTEANHMLNITARGQLHRCIGAELAGQTALLRANCGPSELDFVELYSCFPVAVESYANELQLPENKLWSFTGGMPFAGGPFNNFVLHSVGQLATHIRRKPHSRGMVTTVSGVLTKQGFGIWGADANPDGYQFIDVTNEVIDATDEREVLPDYEGAAMIVGYTVIHERNAGKRGIAVVELSDGKRSIGSTTDTDFITAMQQTDVCGSMVNINAGRLSPRET